MSTKSWTGDYVNYNRCPRCGKPYWTQPWDFNQQGTCQCWTSYVYTTTSSWPQTPKLSMRDLMEEIGKLGHHVLVRYDPERADGRWTIIIGGKRVSDTDNPTKVLRKYLAEVQNGRKGEAGG